MIFLSSPYTHVDKKIQQERYDKVAEIAAKLTSNGEHAFSPIIYGLELCKYKDMPTDFKFWGDFCMNFLKRCDKMYVLQFDGWESSTGVQAEIKFAKENNITIHYLK